jgi:hypothetical protein
VSSVGCSLSANLSPQGRRCRLCRRRLTSARRKKKKSLEVVMAPRQRSRTSSDDGGGGNRTRVRGRPVQSVYKLRLPLRFARRPVGSRPTAGLAILWCRTSGDWLSLGAEPVSDAATRATGRARSDALRYGLGSESECVIVLRTCIVSRLFYEADRGPRLAALPENRPRRNQVAPVCQFLNSSRPGSGPPCATTSAVWSSKKNAEPLSPFGSTQIRPPIRPTSSLQM